MLYKFLSDYKILWIHYDILCSTLKTLLPDELTSQERLCCWQYAGCQYAEWCSMFFHVF